jgi:hypothetical protein
MQLPNGLSWDAGGYTLRSCKRVISIFEACRADEILEGINVFRHVCKKLFSCLEVGM